MQKIIWFGIALVMLTAGAATVQADGAPCSWGISTLRWDAKYPPGWESIGGMLDIRNPFVRLHSDGTRLYIKGFEFDVRNSTTTGQNNDPNPLVEGVLGAVASYLSPSDGARHFVAIPFNHIFEKGASGYYQVQFSPAINSGYVRLTADIPVGTASDEEHYIPSDAMELVLSLIYRGSFAYETQAAVGLGTYFFDWERQYNTRLAFFRQYGGLSAWGGFFHPSNIFTVLPSGEDLRSITAVSSQIPQNGESYTAYFDPAWSPDGKLLAMQKQHCGEIDGGIPTDPAVSCSEENWSQDIIIVDHSTAPPNPDMPTQLIRLEKIHVLKSEVGAGRWTDLGGPAFLPDGNKLIAQSSEPGPGDMLWWFDLQAPNTNFGLIGEFYQDENNNWRTNWFQKQLTGGMASVHPDGNIIAYSYHEGELELENNEVLTELMPRNIHTINLDGTQDTALTDDEYFNLQQNWSPDGNWLVFVSNLNSSDPKAPDNGVMDIWIMDRNGQNKIMIYDAADSSMTPSFSPDGTRIAFSNNSKGRICSVNLAGKDLKVIYERPEGSPDLIHSAKWSPYLTGLTPTITLQSDVLVAQRTGSGISDVTLSWASDKADRVVIDNGVGEQAALSGSIVISPLDTQAEAPYMLVYTATAYNWAGKSSASVFIKVVDN